jgi:hypothetical protein
MLALSVELGNPENASEVRAQAGLQLKQCLTSKDELIDSQLVEFWVALDEEARQTVRDSVRLTLGDWLSEGKRLLEVNLHDPVGACYSWNRVRRPIYCSTSEMFISRRSSCLTPVCR